MWPSPLPTARMSQRLGSLLTSRLRAGGSQIGSSLSEMTSEWRDRVGSATDAGLLDEAESIEANRWMRDPASGQALALMSFLSWRRSPEQLSLAEVGDFRDLRFGARLPTGARGTPPQLDLIAAGASNLVAVSSVGLSYLRGKTQPLPQSYEQLAMEAELEDWALLGRKASRNELNFRYVDVAALVRFAIGLGRNFPSHRTCLLYLFLEPSDASGYALFGRHRDELELVQGYVRSGSVQFIWMSFADLWSSWADMEGPCWLPPLVEDLRSRYGVALADLAGLSSPERRVA